MKTREELLKMFEGDKLFYPKRSILEDQYRNICLLDILDVLAAPTEGQTKCEYCRNEKRIKFNSYQYLEIAPGEVRLCEKRKFNFEDWQIGTADFKHCPMCGRRLG